MRSNKIILCSEWASCPTIKTLGKKKAARVNTHVRKKQHDHHHHERLLVSTEKRGQQAQPNPPAEQPPSIPWKILRAQTLALHIHSPAVAKAPRESGTARAKSRAPAPQELIRCWLTDNIWYHSQNCFQDHKTMLRGRSQRSWLVS